MHIEKFYSSVLGMYMFEILDKNLRQVKGTDIYESQEEARRVVVALLALGVR